MNVHRGLQRLLAAFSIFWIFGALVILGADFWSIMSRQNTADERLAAIPSRPPRWSDVLMDPRYPTLTEEQKRKLQQKFFQRVVIPHPNYQELSRLQQQQVKEGFFANVAQKPRSRFVPADKAEPKRDTLAEALAEIRSQKFSEVEGLFDEEPAQPTVDELLGKIPSKSVDHHIRKRRLDCIPWGRYSLWTLGVPIVAWGLYIAGGWVARGFQGKSSTRRTGREGELGGGGPRSSL